MPAPQPIDIAVLAGSSWSSLRTHLTRWRAVVESWRSRPDIGRLVVVDYPALGRRAWRAAVVPSEDWVPRPSWLPGVDVVSAGVAVHPAVVRPTDPVVWRWTARRLARGLGFVPSLVACANPLWMPVAPYLGAGAILFDAVDDWCANPAFAGAHPRLHAGYAEAREATVITTPSPGMAQQLAERYGISSVVVPNGVDLSRFDAPGPAPTGLPSGPFAVYVGVVQSRVDLDLLVATHQRALPVVVAGPGDPAMLEQLRAAGACVLGAVAPELVPGLLSRARVGLVPHRPSAFTETMDPMKIPEYLAAGLPVITTAVPAGAWPAVRVAADAEEFVAGVAKAASDPRPDLRAVREAIRGREWSDVAARLLGLALARGVARVDVA